MFSRTKKQAQQTAQRLVSGHLTLIAWWTLKNAGVLEAILAVEKETPPDEGLELLVHALRKSMAPDVLYALVEYLEAGGLLERKGDRAMLTAEGRALLEHEDSLLEMVRSYQPVLGAVEHMLAKLKTAGASAVRRKTETLAEAQAKRHGVEVYPAIKGVIEEKKLTHLLDLNCGTGDLLIHLAKEVKNVVGVGICADGALARRANGAITAAGLEKRLIAVPANPLEAITSTRGTFERIGISRQLWTDIDCLIATNIFTEVQAKDAELRGDAKSGEHVVKVLSAIPKHFPKVHVVLVEPTSSARFEKTYFAAEMALLMRLSKTTLMTVERWREVLKESKLTVVEEKGLQTDGLTMFFCRA